jgi:hypothetical protein
MTPLTRPCGTEQDINKTNKFNEAETTFHDPLAATFDDPDHSHAERRLLTVGYSSAGRLLVVSHTEIGAIIRIINARPATAHERKRHET